MTMKNPMVRCLLVALSIFSLEVAGHESHSADIRVEAPWSREMPPVARNGAVYLSLMNHGEAADRLLGASTPVAERVELHGHTMDQGVARMRRIKSIDLPPDAPVVLQPGGTHLMLLGLEAPLVRGERFPLDLEFARSGHIQVEVEVLAPDAVGGGSPTSEQHGSHDTMAKRMKPQAMRGDAKSGEEPKVFEFDIVEGKLGETEPVVEVAQGDVVELHWTTDEELTLHMHGYNVELEVAPGERAVMRVDTTKTGRFPVLNHDSNPPYVLLYMDVTAR